VTPIPPRQVEEEFKGATQASIKSDDELNKAKADASSRVSKAQEDYQARINAAQTDRTTFVSQLESEAKQFSDLFPEYKKNPELFMRQRQTEVLGNIYENAYDIWHLPKGPKGQPLELRLQLNREPKESK
jgi:regulator of protease activity HflC (stomatin/prohibitin superfamily)